MSGPDEISTQEQSGAAVPQVATERPQPGEELVKAPVKITPSRQPIARLTMADPSATLQPKAPGEYPALVGRLMYEALQRSPQNVTEEERLRMMSEQLSDDIQQYGTEAAAKATVSEPTDRGVLDFARKQIEARRAATVDTSLQVGDKARAEQQKTEAILWAQWEAQKAALSPELQAIANAAVARVDANTIRPEARRENLAIEVVTDDGAPLSIKGVGKFADVDIPIMLTTNEVKAGSVVAIGTGPNGADNMRVYEATTVQMRGPEDKKRTWDGQVTLRPVTDPTEEGQLYQSRTIFSTEPSAGTLAVPLAESVRTKLGIKPENIQAIERRLQPTSQVGRAAPR